MFMLLSFFNDRLIPFLWSFPNPKRLWGSFGTMSALLQEIISIYPVLSPPALTALASNRVCNALALLQCVASHNETRALFLHAHIPLFLYPFLNTNSKSRPFEYLRLTSLGVSMQRAACGGVRDGSKNLASARVCVCVRVVFSFFFQYLIFFF